MQETQETPVWSLAWEDSLEKEMATHSSIPVWKISWREEPKRLQSMGSQRGRQNWATEHARTKTNKWANNIQHFPQFDLFSKEKHARYILVTGTLMLNWISFSVQHGRTPIMASSPLWVILQVLYWEPLW